MKKEKNELDYYQTLESVIINKGIYEFLKGTCLNAASVGNINLYKLLYTYFGDISCREQMYLISEEYDMR
jgi:hypothetical protein